MRNPAREQFESGQTCSGKTHSHPWFRLPSTSVSSPRVCAQKYASLDATESFMLQTNVYIHNTHLVRKVQT